MFIHAGADTDMENAAVIGKLLRVDGAHAILQHGTADIRVAHRDLDNYQGAYVLVMGPLRDGVLHEENAFPIEEDFDHATYMRLVAASTKAVEPIF